MAARAATWSTIFLSVTQVAMSAATARQFDGAALAAGGRPAGSASLPTGTIKVFARRWLHRLPMPLGSADRYAGYWWEASMRQAGVSRTIVFDAQRRARFFFEALIGDNLDIGRPANAEIIVGRQVRRNTLGTFCTATGRPADRRPRRRWRGDQPVLQALADQAVPQRRARDAHRGRHQRPRDIGCNARLPNLADLQDKARAGGRQHRRTLRFIGGVLSATDACPIRPSPADSSQPADVPSGTRSPLGAA